MGAELKKYGLRYDDLLDPLQSLVRVCRQRSWARPVNHPGAC